MMDLIDRTALRKTWGMAAECGLCDRDVDDCRLHGFTTEQVCIGLDNALTIPAVPLDKLCEFLAGIYGSPCQLGEIECYPQCEPDGEGMCLGMRSNDVTCWKSYLTKWMEGLDAAD